ncbi:MAG: response regulator [Pseudomonadales bacterium]|nr:response regulator [Pseudomonadales bacterium]
MNKKPTYEELLEKIWILEHAESERLQADSKLAYAWLDCSPVCTKMVDLDFNLQYMSSAGINVLKIDDISQYYGKPYPFDFFPESYRISMRRYLENARHTHEVIAMEAPIADTQGNQLWFHATIVPVNDDAGRLEYFIVVSIDITARKQAELALAQRNNHLKELVDERTKELQVSMKDLLRIQENLMASEKKATAASCAKSEFLALVSHEIRTPMNGITAMADLLLDIVQGEKQREYANIIKQSSSALLSIVNDILDISKIESGRLELELKPFNLQNVLNEVSALFAAQVSKKEIDFQCLASADVPKSIISDATALRQILINLLSNAMKFTGDNGDISLHVGLAKDNSQTKAVDHIGLTFTVKDSGIGIPIDKQSKVFEAFTQADSSITRKFGGTGLGLHICKQLCELMGGDIQLESLTGEGTTVIVNIDVGLAKVIDDLAQESTAIPSVPVSDESILLVEDNQVNQKVASAILKKLGYKVHIVDNGIQAIEEAFSNHYDIILMDCQMPIMDGYTATRKLRLDKRCCNIPIIAMSAGVTRDEQLNCKEAGMDDFIAKPINIDLVRTVLARWH